MKNSLYKKLLTIQTELKAPKSQFNSFGKYSYRSCEDILEAVKPLCNKHQVLLFISDQKKEMNDGYKYVESTVTVTDGEDTVSVTAQAGISEGKKGMDESQVSGSASSYARKYALNGLFLIDDTKDADATNRHGKDSNSSSNAAKGKDRLPKSGELFDRAKDYIKNGGSMATVKAKYQVSKEVETLLTK